MSPVSQSSGAVGSESSKQSKHPLALRLFYSAVIAVVGAALLPVIPVAARPVTPSISSTPSAYTALTPVRIFDTRNGTGTTQAPLNGPGSRDLVIAGSNGVPAGATGVVLNVTVVNTNAASFLTVYPMGTTRQLTSNLNWVAGQVVPNLVESPLNSGGVTFYNSAGQTDVVADLEGYFTAPSGNAGGEVGLTPARISDTRAGSGYPNAGGTLAAGGSLDIQVTGAGGVPLTGVAGAVLNVTVTNTTAPSFLTVWPQGSTRNLVSNLNWVAGLTVPNRVFVPVGPTGKVSVYSPSGSVDVIVDVGGYFTDSTAAGKPFTPQSPVRIADSRIALGCAAALGGGGICTLPIAGTNGVPANASAVILNGTVTNTTAPSFLTVYPSTATKPLASDLNWMAGVTVPNLIVATLGTTGSINIYNSAGSTDVVVDLFGYFAAAIGNSVSVSATSSSIAANGTSTTTVSATVTSGGSPVSGNVVTFSAGMGSPAAACGAVSPTTATTNASGVATTTYTSSTTAGTCMVMANEAGGGSGMTTITQTTPSNAAYTVTTTPTTPPLSTSGSPDAGNVTVTATGLPVSSTVCISLFPADGVNAPVNTGGTWTFTVSAGTAAGEGTTDSNSAFIRSINGAPTGLNDATNTTRHQCSIGTGTTGSVTFILNSFAPDKAVPVVYTDTNLNGKLNLASSGQPSEPFGVGPTATWQAPGAGIGSYAGLIVQSIDTSAKTFQGCTTPGNGSTCNTFNYGTAGNTFNYPSPGSSGTGTVPVTQAQFESYLSAQAPPFCAPPCTGTGGFTPFGSQVPGDQLNIVNYNPSASSQFTFAQGAGTNGDVPSAPTGVTATYNGSAAPAGVILTWTAPNNPDVAQDASNSAMYCVLRADVSVGTFLPFTGSGNANCPVGGTGNAIVATGGAAPATTLTDVSGAAGTTYVYKVFARADNNGGAKWGPASAQSNQATVIAAAPKTPTSKQSVITQGPTGNNLATLDAGDTLQWVFDNVSASNPLTVAGTWSINLLDFYGAEVQVSNTNATAIVSGSGTTLTISVTGAPTLVSPATGGSPTPTSYFENARGAVKSTTGIGNAAGAWNLPGSGCVPNFGGCPGGTTFTRQVPFVQRNILATNNTTNNTTDSTGGSPGDYLPFRVFSVTASTSTNKVTLPAGQAGGTNNINNNDPFAVFDGSGTQIASGTYNNAAGTSVTPSPALAAGQTIYVVYSYQFSNSAGTVTSTRKTMWPSRTTQLTASVYTFSPSPIAATGALGPSQAVAVTLNTGTAGSTVYLSFMSGATPPASASVGGIALTGTPTAFTADSSGNVFITYTSSSAGNSAANSSVLDSITAQNGPTPASTTQSASDSYIYAPAPPTAANSTLTAAPTSVPDDNVTTSTVTVTLLNGNNVAVAGKTVVLNQNAGASSTITGGAQVTNGAGQASWTVKNAFPETVTYTATDTTDGVVVSQTATVTFFQRVNNGLSTISATPAGPLTAGTPTSITVTVRDDSGNPIVGYSVTLTHNGSATITPVTNPQVTNSSGQVTWIANDTVAETPFFNATGPALNGGTPLVKQVLVTWVSGPVTAGNSGATASPTTGVPDNNNTGPAPARSIITVTLRDVNNNPVLPGRRVSLSATTNGAGGTINGFVGTGPVSTNCVSSPFCFTDGLGQVTFRVGDNTVETVTYTATDTTDSVVVTQTPTVGFVNPIYTSASGIGGSLQITATFNDAVCRNSAFLVGDWTVSGSVQGPITVSSDNANICNSGSSNGTTTVKLTLGSIMATGQTITVTLTPGGAGSFQNITLNSPTTAAHTFAT